MSICAFQSRLTSSTLPTHLAWTPTNILVSAGLLISVFAAERRVCASSVIGVASSGLSARDPPVSLWTHTQHPQRSLKSRVCHTAARTFLPIPTRVQACLWTCGVTQESPGLGPAKTRIDYTRTEAAGAAGLEYELPGWIVEVRSRHLPTRASIDSNATLLARSLTPLRRITTLTRTLGVRVDGRRDKVHWGLAKA